MHGKNEIAKFYLSSFQNVITINANPRMGIELFELIRTTPGVGKELYALSEKIKTQLYHMNRISEIKQDVLTGKTTPQGNGDSGEHPGDVSDGVTVSASGVGELAVA